MTTETKVEAVAWIDMAKLSAHGMVYATSFKCGDRQSPVFPASAITALEGERDAAERRVAELEAAAEPFVRFSSGERYIDLRMPTSAIERMRRLLRKDDALTKETP